MQTILTNRYEINHSKQILQILKEKSFRTMLTHYYNRNHCNQCSKTIIGMSFQTSLTKYNRTHSKQHLQTIIAEIIQNDAYKLLAQN